MLHAKFVAAAFALVAVVAIPHGLINYCFTSAQAQTQTTLAEPTIWDHNYSIMYLVANGSSREFYYQKPRSGMLDAGARPGSVLFRGEVKDGQYFGTA
jgi:hypothetical protein